jgi:hypothetical protein
MMLMQVDLLNQGASASTLAKAALDNIDGGNSIYKLMNLENFGYVTSTAGRPVIWRYTAEGLARAQELLREGYTPPRRGPRGRRLSSAASTAAT